MKNLDLRKLPTKLINLDSQPDRLRMVASRLGELGITFDRFSAFPHQCGIVGCGQSHLEVLSNIKPKTLVFEDDVVPTEWFQPIVEVPEEADALYLGNSIWGYHESLWPVGSVPQVKVRPYSANYLRIFNMCSAHAIVYLKQEFIDAVIKMTKKCLKEDIPWDLGLAKLHSDFTILVPKNPMFYQEELREHTLVRFEPKS
tara:strand:+ start:813 stop:1412 length:600 start_codon:yes stop_codon:yes gene_type:complete